MSDKPSLYVVEKREVVILVVLFVLVTVLSFTLGVRYGQNVGRKMAETQTAADKAHGGERAEGIGGTLGKGEEAPESAAGKHEENTEAKGEKSEEGHGAHAEAKTEHAAHAEHATHEDHPAAHAEEHTAPEAAAKSGGRGAGAPAPAHEVADKNSDEYLLNALKDAGVEPPGGKAPHDARLPDEVKHVRGGTYLIQVGSHPTRGEAEAQVRQLKARQVQADILPPFKDKQGEWHRVVIGNFKSKRDAEKEAGSLKGKGAILSYFVWRLP